MTDTPSEPSLPLHGGCMCGAVRFSVSRPLLGALYCHCKRCQQRTGTAFSVTALTEIGSLAVTDGDDCIRTWDPGDGGWLKAFCATCGSQLYASDPQNPELVAVRMGSIDGDPGIRPLAHQFTRYAAVWQPIPDDGLPRFPERLSADAMPEQR